MIKTFDNFFDITEIVNKEGNIIIDYSDEQIINFENNCSFFSIKYYSECQFYNYQES